MGFSKEELQRISAKDFKPSTRGLIKKSIFSGYQLVADLYNSEKWLAWRIGDDYRRYLIRIAVEHQLKAYVESGYIKMEAQTTLNKSGNYSHLEITSDNCIITINQVQSKSMIPRKAKFREKLASMSQQYRIETSESNVSPLIKQKYYGMLTYGNNKDQPEFINLGFPDVNTGRWIYRLDLIDEIFELDVPTKEIVAIEEEALVKVKESIKKVNLNHEASGNTK